MSEHVCSCMEEMLYVCQEKGLTQIAELFLSRALCELVLFIFSCHWERSGHIAISSPPRKNCSEYYMCFLFNLCPLYSSRIFRNTIQRLSSLTPVLVPKGAQNLTFLSWTLAMFLKCGTKSTANTGSTYQLHPANVSPCQDQQESQNALKGNNHLLTLYTRV